MPANRCILFAFVCQIASCADNSVEHGSNQLFLDLFGARDATLRGHVCRTGSDQCRGSATLLVCLDDARNPIGTEPTCRSCATDDECWFEYTYFSAGGDSFVRCGGDGTCHLVDGNLGSCTIGTPACRTHLQWYSCITGQCDRCATPADCMTEYGPNWICDNFGAAPSYACHESLALEVE